MENWNNWLFTNEEKKGVRNTEKVGQRENSNIANLNQNISVFPSLLINSVFIILRMRFC